MRSAGESGQEAYRAAHALPTAIHGPRGLQPPGAAPLSGNPAGVGDLRPAARPSPSATRLSPASPAQGRQPKLLDRLREALRSRHYSLRTEQSYCHWVKRFIFFHNVRHPAEMAEPEINAFLTNLAIREKISASTQNQALSALLFLGHKDVKTTVIYTHVLNRGGLGVRSPVDAL